MTELGDYKRLVEKPMLDAAQQTRRLLNGRIDRLEKALKLALGLLVHHEPGDSRAVSPEFVAMAAVLDGEENTPLMAVLDDALKAHG